MNGSDIYTLVTGIMGYAPDTTLYYTLLNLCQGIRENMRPWMILKKEDTSNQVPPTNQSAFLTPYSLPADFRKFYSPKRSVQLADASNIVRQWYVQIPKDRKLECKDDNTKFYVDYILNQLFLCGIVNQLYTMHIYYICRSPLITATQAWVFPSEYAPILAYDVCELLKAGIDSDTVNAAQAVANGRTSAIIYSQMAEWDNDLATDSIEGATYGDIGGDASFLSRTVPGTNNGSY